MQNKYGFIYIWYDRKHTRFYIGSHWGTEDDGYICSSPWMKQSYKHRPYDFKRKVLASNITDRKTLLDEEFKWLSMIKDEEIGKRYYNLNKRYHAHWSADPESTKSVKQKLSEIAKRNHNDPEFRKKYLEGMSKRETEQSDETKEKRRQSMTKTMAEKFPVEERYIAAAKGSEEHRQKLSEASLKMWETREKPEKKVKIKKERISKKGIPLSESHAKAISEGLKGKPRSDEAKAAISVAKKGKPGRKKTEEEKRKISEKMKLVRAAKKSLNSLNV